MIVSRPQEGILGGPESTVGIHLAYAVSRTCPGPSLFSAAGKNGSPQLGPTLILRYPRGFQNDIARSLYLGIPRGCDTRVICRDLNIAGKVQSDSGRTEPNAFRCGQREAPDGGGEWRFVFPGKSSR